MVEFLNIQDLVVRIQKAVNAIILKINQESQGEPFYGRVNLVDDKELIGLISDLSVNSSKITFSLTKERLVRGKISSRTWRQEVPFEKIKGIDPFKTQSGKPIIILPDDFTR